MISGTRSILSYLSKLVSYHTKSAIVRSCTKSALSTGTLKVTFWQQLAMTGRVEFGIKTVLYFTRYKAAMRAQCFQSNGVRTVNIWSAEEAMAKQLYGLPPMARLLKPSPLMPMRALKWIGKIPMFSPPVVEKTCKIQPTIVVVGRCFIFPRVFCVDFRAVVICSVSAGENPVKKFTDHSQEVNSVLWSPSGEFLASVSDDQTAKIWTLEEGLKHDLRGHTQEVLSAKWTSTGQNSKNPDTPLYLCTASVDGSVRIWDALAGQLVHTLAKYSTAVCSIAISPEGELQQFALIVCLLSIVCCLIVLCA